MTSPAEESTETRFEHGTLDVSVEDITPDLAQEYLEKNFSNRHVRVDTVAAYARDMREGRWLLTGQGISFDVTGRLTDGQHRLHAIIACKDAIKMLVVRGAPLHSERVMDGGIKRTMADFLGMDDIPNRMVTSSVARLGLLYDKGEIHNAAHRVVTNPELLEYWGERSEELGRAAERAMHYRKAVPVTTSVLGTAYMLFRRSDVPACTEFFESIAQMTLTGNGDPRLALYRKLNAMRNDRARASQLYNLDLFIRSWNAWRTDEKFVVPWLSKPVQLPKVV